MAPGELAGIHHPVTEDYSIPSSDKFGVARQSNIQAFHFNRLRTNFQNSPFPRTGHAFTPQQTTLFINNSPCNEAQLNIIDERKRRRKISNRESARRSRMRKQRYLNELWSQVVRLRTENNNLLDKLNHASESHHLVLQENARLKEEASDLRQMLTDLQIGSPYTS